MTSSRHKTRSDQPSRKLKRSTLLIGLGLGLAFSIVMGITAGAMGFGSIYPQVNLIAQPLVCPGAEMTYSRRVSEIGTARYYTAEWFCVDERTGVRNTVEPNQIYICAGLFYGLLFFVLLVAVTYVYWYSSIGPAKNGGPRLH